MYKRNLIQLRVANVYVTEEELPLQFIGEECNALLALLEGYISKIELPGMRAIGRLESFRKYELAKQPDVNLHVWRLRSAAQLREKARGKIAQTAAASAPDAQMDHYLRANAFDTPFSASYTKT
jgi:hypothetical protein